MKIDKDDRRLLLKAFYLSIGNQKGALQCFHKHPTLQVEDTYLDPTGGCQNSTPDPGSSGRIIGRADNARIGENQRHLLFLVPDVVAARQQMNAVSEQLLGDLYRQPEPSGGILAVGNNDIYRVPVHQAM